MRRCLWCRYPAINFQDLSYYSAPKQKSEKVRSVAYQADQSCYAMVQGALRLPDMQSIASLI